MAKHNEIVNNFKAHLEHFDFHQKEHKYLVRDFFLDFFFACFKGKSLYHEKNVLYKTHVFCDRIKDHKRQKFLIIKGLRALRAKNSPL